MQCQNNIEEIDNQTDEEHLPLAKIDGQNTIKVSKCQEVAPQIIAVGVQNLLIFTVGTSLGFAAILIPELNKDNAEIVVTLDELTWISSITVFLIPIGSFFSGIISEYIGRKMMSLISVIPFIIVWTMLHYAKSYMELFIALAISGLVGGLFESAAVTYVTEITTPEWRGILSSVIVISVTSGISSQLFGAALATWRTMALVNLVFPILAFIGLCFIPESPHWLASKGQFGKAEEALCWFRGWVSPIHVKQEFLMLQESMKIREANVSKLKGKFWMPYFQRRVYVPFFIVTTSFVAVAFGGSGVTHTFTVIIFDHLKSPFDKYTTSAILGVSQVVGTILCIGLIRFTGRRKLFFSCITLSAVLFLLTAVYGFLMDYNIINYEHFSWIPMTTLVVESLVAHMGVRMLPWVLVGELFPSDVRSVSAGITSAIGITCHSIVRKIFLYMVRSFTMAGVMLFFAVISFASFIIMYLILPETEGKTLLEIEKHFSDKSSIKEFSTR